MIPVYAHRYLPAGRGTCRHPVLSTWQADIIIYGTDLAEYITREFTSPGRSISPDWAPPPLAPFCPLAVALPAVVASSPPRPPAGRPRVPLS